MEERVLLMCLNGEVLHKTKGSVAGCANTQITSFSQVLHRRGFGNHPHRLAAQDRASVPVR